ncbi:hypothetical protein D3C78_670830 [compost metagenome]
MGNDEGRCRAGNAGHAVMLCQPDAVIAVFFGLDRHSAGILKRLTDALAFADRRKVENGKRYHPTLLRNLNLCCGCKARVPIYQ